MDQHQEVRTLHADEVDWFSHMRQRPRIIERVRLHPRGSARGKDEVVRTTASFAVTQFEPDDISVQVEVWREVGWVLVAHSAHRFQDPPVEHGPDLHRVAATTAIREYVNSERAVAYQILGLNTPPRWW